MSKICLIGCYPPPYGGESIEVEGIATRLRREGVECRVLDVGENRRTADRDCVPVQGVFDFLIRIVRAARANYLIHLITNGHNTKSWLTATLVAWAGLFNRRRTLLTLGSGDMPHYADRQAGWRRRWMRWVLRRYRLVIARNERAAQTLERIGLSREYIRLVAPYSGELEPEPGKIPAEVSSFLSDYDPVLVSAVAFRPEYGIELALDAIQSLKEHWPRIGLVLLGTRTGEGTARIEVKKRSLEDRICFAGGMDHQAYLAVVSRSTAFLRTTLFDGDASSVRESIALGVPTIASRTDFRPAGTTTFEVGSLDDLLDQLNQVLENPGAFIPNDEQKAAACGRLEKVFAVYGEILVQAGKHPEQLPDILKP